MRIENARFNGVDFIEAKFTQTASFTKVEFLNFALFGNAQFTGTTGNGYTVKFEDSRFEGITEFSGTAFMLGDEKSVGFLKVQFEDFTDFKGTKFNCHVVFRDGSVMEAEVAAKVKDSSKVAESLKSAGKWTLDLASKIGASLAAEAIKHSMGMK